MVEYYDPETYPKEWNYLQSGTVVDDYIIEREIAHGGFSSVYLARDRLTQEQVALKEYLPRKLAHRTWNNNVVANSEESKKLMAHGRTLFIDEAKVLASLKHPNIVEVVNFFQSNSTVYIVMTYGYGLTLDKLLKSKKISITDQWLMNILEGLLEALNLVHKNNILHLDIKPANLLIRPGNNVILLDFGAIQPYPLSKAKGKAYVLTKGFSPIEQYSSGGILGPCSDIYAVGASLRACLDFSIPPQALDRANGIEFLSATKMHKGQINTRLLEILDWTMELMPEQRPQTVKELQDALAEVKID